MSLSPASSVMIIFLLVDSWFRRYILHPDRAGTLVEHAYVWGYAWMPLLTVWLPGFPRRMRPAMERSLENLAALADTAAQRRTAQRGMAMPKRRVAR